MAGLGARTVGVAKTVAVAAQTVTRNPRRKAIIARENNFKGDLGAVPLERSQALSRQFLPNPDLELESTSTPRSGFSLAVWMGTVYHDNIVGTWKSVKKKTYTLCMYAKLGRCFDALAAALLSLVRFFVTVIMYLPPT
jgi:hypothetical protein